MTKSPATMTETEMREILSQIARERRQGTISTTQAEAEVSALLHWYTQQRA